MHNVTNEWTDYRGRRYTVISDHALTHHERLDVVEQTAQLEARLRSGEVPVITTLSPDDAAIPAGVRFDRALRRMGADASVSMNPELKRRRTESPLGGIDYAL